MLGAVLLLGSGCASLFSESQYPVSINSSPNGATATVRDDRGQPLYKIVTPNTVYLSAKSGYFSRARYSVEFEKEGYIPAVRPLWATMDDWYAGNVLFGGPIGLLLVDPATGAMWKLDRTMYSFLQPAAPASQPAPSAVPPADQPVVAEAPPSQPPQDVGEKFLQLRELKDAGLLTEEEFEQKRRALVDRL
jgi:hypothetical protein